MHQLGIHGKVKTNSKQHDHLGTYFSCKYAILFCGPELQT